MPRDRAGSARWSLVAVAATVGLLPLVTDPGGWYVFVGARWAVLAAVVALLVLGLATRGRLLPPPAVRWWAGLLLVAVVSAAGSGAVEVSLFGAVDRRAGAAMWLLHGAMAAIGASVVRRRSDLAVLVRGVAVGAIGVTAFVAAQRLGWTFPSGVVRGNRPGGSLGNADFLGAFAVLGLFVPLGAVLDRDEPDGWRLVHAVAAVGSAFCLVLSGTRASWLAVVVGLFVFGAAVVRRSGLTVWHALRVTGVVLVGLVGLALWSGTSDRVETLTSGTAAGRLATWERTASVIGDRPVLGWGPEGFAAGFGRAVDDTWERAYGRRLTPDRAHNGLLDVGATLGLVGLAAYLGLVIASGRAVRRSLRTAGSSTMVGIATGLLAYLVQQQFLFQLVDVDAIAWLLLGAVVGCAPVGVGTVSSPVPASHPSTPLRIAATAVAAPFIAIALVAASGVLADRSARRSDDRSGPSAVTAANAALDREPQTLFGLQLADAALRSGSVATVDAARDRLGAVRDATFDDGRLTLARARLARADGRLLVLGQSLDEVRQLLVVDPSRGDGWLEAGELLVGLGRDGDAQQAFRRTVALAPQRSDAWVALALAAAHAGDDGTARWAFDHVEPAMLGPEALTVRQRLLSERPMPAPAR